MTPEKCEIGETGIFLIDFGVFAVKYTSMLQAQEQQYLKTSEVARILSVSTQTIYNWLREGRISEPERHPLTLYRRWTTKDVDMIRNAVRESRQR